MPQKSQGRKQGKEGNKSFNQAMADLKNNLLETKKVSQSSENIKDQYERTKEILTRKTPDNETRKLKIDLLYPAPYNKEWNSFKPITPDKEFELDKSILEVGLLSPIVVYEIDKEKVADLYEEDINNPYVFGTKDNKYMVLAGHSRVSSYFRLYNATKDERFLYIDAIVKMNIDSMDYLDIYDEDDKYLDNEQFKYLEHERARYIDHDQARYIINVTNFASRQLSTSEKRNSMNHMYRMLHNKGLKEHQIAMKIAEDSGKKVRTVRYYNRINNNIIDDFGNMLDDGFITQTSAYKLSGFTKSMQQWICDNYKDQISDKVISAMNKSYKEKSEFEAFFKRETGKVGYVTVKTVVPSELEHELKNYIKKWICDATKRRSNPKI